MSDHHDILVFIVERDIYARQAITSYLSWNRYTRVVGRAGTLHEMFARLQADPVRAHLDVVVLDAGLAAGADELVALLTLIAEHCPATAVVCLAHRPDREMALAASRGGARAYLTREQVGIGIANAVRFALRHRFVVTQDVADLFDDPLSRGFEVLPRRRRYPRLTQRIEQALWLCVVEGLPAELAAEEMGVSTNTVRSYIKEGYRILEAYDDTSYPATVSPVERAFLRYTALERMDKPWEFDTPYQPAA